MRDGINRLRNVKRYSGQHSTICTPVPEFDLHRDPDLASERAAARGDDPCGRCGETGHRGWGLGAAQKHRGEIYRRARLFDGVRRGVLIAESIWPNAAHPFGRGINTLTGADAVAPYGGAAFHDNRAALERVSAKDASAFEAFAKF
jgi:hypothetical protein